MLESTSSELQQTLQAKDGIIGGLQEQLDHLRKSLTAQVSHMHVGGGEGVFMNICLNT